MFWHLAEDLHTAMSAAKPSSYFVNSKLMNGVRCTGKLNGNLQIVANTLSARTNWNLRVITGWTSQLIHQILIADNCKILPSLQTLSVIVFTNNPQKLRQHISSRFPVTRTRDNSVTSRFASYACVPTNHCVKVPPKSDDLYIYERFISLIGPSSNGVCTPPYLSAYKRQNCWMAKKHNSSEKYIQGR